MTIQKISQNLKNSKLISLYNNALFIFKCFLTNKTPSSARKHRKGTKPRTRKIGQMFFFFLLSSDGLAQYCMNLSHWFTHEIAAFCMEQYTTPSLYMCYMEKDLCRGVVYLTVVCDHP